MSEFVVNDDMFGRYCRIKTDFSEDMHMYKIVSLLESNNYCNVPLRWNSGPTLHKDVVPVLLVIHCGIDETKVQRVALSDCEVQPTADVAKARYGEWLKHYRSGTTVSDGYVSSCCDMWNERKSLYCPYCGARMDGVKNMKSVLISIKPKGCELIASGKKTTEDRETRPKCDTPFKCYIYCTKDKGISFWMGKRYAYADNRSHNLFDVCGNGKVIGEFVCRNMNGKRNHGWRWGISDLVIYDKPKELREFYKYCGDNPDCDGCEAHYYTNTECGLEDYCCSKIDGCRPITRPPQSWCYCEVEE